MTVIHTEGQNGKRHLRGTMWLTRCRFGYCSQPHGAAGGGTGFGPGFDRVTAALAAEGVGPDQIDTVWLTHLHADHVGGLLTSEGRARYDRAELVVQEREAAFWSDEGARARAPAAMAVFFDTAQAVLAAYEQALRENRGAAEHGGKMIDAPVVARALETLASHRRISGEES